MITHNYFRKIGSIYSWMSRVGGSFHAGNTMIFPNKLDLTLINAFWLGEMKVEIIIVYQISLYCIFHLLSKPTKVQPTELIRFQQWLIMRNYWVLHKKHLQVYGVAYHITLSQPTWLWQWPQIQFPGPRSITQSKRHISNSGQLFSSDNTAMAGFRQPLLGVKETRAGQEIPDKYRRAKKAWIGQKQMG